jgi:hypothetical protein
LYTSSIYLQPIAVAHPYWYFFISQLKKDLTIKRNFVARKKHTIGNQP